MKFLNPFRLFWFDNGVFRCSLVPMLFGGGGGPSQTTSTVTQSSIPDWLQPQTQAMLGAATQQIFNTDGSTITGIKGYNPYSANPLDYVAQFSPMQQQSFSNAASLQTPSQYNVASDIVGNTGLGAAGTASTALGYGTQGAGYGGAAAGLAGQGLGYQAAGQNIAGQAAGYGAQAAQQGDIYGQRVTSPSTVQSYMSPYQQAVTDVAKAGALRDFQVAQTMRQGNAARAGAFGGGRQAIENAEAQRNLNTQLQNLDVQGQQSAYNAAMQNIQNQAQYKLSGLQGAQQGVQNAISGQQLGLSGLGAANQAYQTGITGANLGLQGVQGAQQGYGLGTQAGTALANIGTQQLAAQQGIIGLQNQYGQQQTQQQQDIINNAIQNYANSQAYPMQQLAMYNALLRGYATPTSAQTVYQAQPSTMSQLGGLAATGLGAYGALSGKKEGGLIKAPKKYASGGLVDLAIAKAMGNA